MGSGSVTFNSRETTDRTQVTPAADQLAPAKAEIDQFRSSGGKLPSYANQESLHTIFGTPTITDDARGAAETDDSAQVIKSFLSKLESVAMHSSSGTGDKVDNATGSPIENIPPSKAFSVGATAGDDCAGQTPPPADGGFYMPRESGTSSTTYKAGDGTIVTKNWGPSPKDNYTLSVYDDTIKIESADGSGSITQTDKDGNVREHSWGKTAAQNYDKMNYANGNFFVTRADHKTYCHFRTANGGYIEHHFGPGPDDNFDQVRTINIGTGDAQFAKEVGEAYEQTIPAADRRILDASGDFALHPPSQIDDNGGNIGPSAGVFGPNDREGIEIATFRKSSDADPANAKRVIYADGGTTDNAGGYFQPTSNEVVIGKMEKVGHTWVKNNEITATVAHEVGHALDHALYDFSQSAEFSSAYQQDLKSMPPCARSSMNYFLPEGRFGSIENAQRETFAQIYANTLGLSPNTPGVEPYFPKTTDVVKKKLAELANADKEHVVGDTE